MPIVLFMGKTSAFLLPGTEGFGFSSVIEHLVGPSVQFSAKNKQANKQKRTRNPRDTNQRGRG